MSRLWIAISIRTKIGMPGRHFLDRGRMLELTDLEVVALSEIAKQHPALVPQVAAAPER